MDMLSMLPVLNGWSWLRITGEKDIPANGEAINVYQSEGPEMGWLISARFSSNVGDATLEITYDPEESGQTITYDMNPETLYNRDYTSESNLPYVANYDDVGNEYLVEFTPRPPMAIRGTLYVRLIPGSSDGTVNYDVQYLQINDIEAFISSLRNVLGIEAIMSLLNNLGYQQPSQPPGHIEMPSITTGEYTGFLP